MTPDNQIFQTDNAQYAPESVSNIADGAIWTVNDISRPKLGSQAVCFQRSFGVCDDKGKEVQAEVGRDIFFRKRAFRVSDLQIAKEFT